MSILTRQRLETHELGVGLLAQEFSLLLRGLLPVLLLFGFSRELFISTFSVHFVQILLMLLLKLLLMLLDFHLFTDHFGVGKLQILAVI